MLTRIAFIGFGEVASALCPALSARGAAIAAYDILLEQSEGLALLQARAAATPVTFSGLADALRGARYVLSTVTTSVALEVARECAPRLVAGERAGLREDLWREVTELMASHPFEKTASNWVRSHATAHARRHQEMKQVANVLRHLGLEPTLTAATQAFFERSGSLGLGERFSATPATMDEVVRYFNERLQQDPHASAHAPAAKPGMKK